MSKKTFRAFLLWYLLLLILSGWIHLAVGDKGIPQGLLEIADKQSLILGDRVPLFLGVILIGLGILTILLTVVGYIGLLLFWRPSRYIFFSAIALQLLFPFSARWSVANSYVSFINSVELLFNGMILALIFWGPASRFFIDQNEISLPETTSEPEN